MPAYLFRLDDITDTINPESFDRCLEVLFRYQVKPLLGVIPENRDESLKRFPARAGFWELLAEYRAHGRVSIALHGLHHVYHENRHSLLFAYGIGPLTEFSGLPEEIQSDKLARGINLLQGRGLAPVLWMAPNHSFDTNTLRALKHSGLLYVTDGIGLFPFHRRGISFIPALSGRPRRIPFGITTICLHTETMKEADFIELETFLEKKPRCLSFEDVLELRTPLIFALVCNLVVRVMFFIIKQATRRFRKPNHS